MTNVALKDSLTEELRQRVATELHWVQETDEAEASLSALSLQSIVHPNRHVWIDTDMDGIALDLEDRRLDDAWDNAIARVKAMSVQSAIEIIGIWLSGTTLSEWFTGINQKYQPIQASRPIHFDNKEPAFS